MWLENIYIKSNIYTYIIETQCSVMKEKEKKHTHTLEKIEF